MNHHKPVWYRLLLGRHLLIVLLLGLMVSSQLPRSMPVVRADSAITNAYMAADTDCQNNDPPTPVTSFPSAVAAVCLYFQGAVQASDSITATVTDSSGHVVYQSNQGASGLYGRGSAEFDPMQYSSGLWSDGTYHVVLQLNGVAVQSLTFTVGSGVPPTATPGGAPPSNTPITPPSNTPVTPPSATQAPAATKITLNSPTATTVPTTVGPLPIGGCGAGTVQSVVRCVKSSVLRVVVKLKDGFVQGTSFVVRSDTTGTYLVTNLHVVQGATADKIMVFTPDEKTHFVVKAVLSNKAKASSGGDLAVIRIQPTGLPALHWGNSETVEVGEAVVSVGYGLAFELVGPPSVTEGIISAVHRDLGDGFGATWIQHQSVINHGNSGGPLLDLQGSVVGVNTLGIDQLPNPNGKGTEPVQGIFFAIPANSAKVIANKLISAIQSGKTITVPLPTPPPTGAGATFRGKGYTFTLPGDWTVKKLTDGSPAFLSADGDVELVLLEVDVTHAISTAGQKTAIQHIADSFGKATSSTPTVSYSPFSIGSLAGTKGIVVNSKTLETLEVIVVTDARHIVLAQADIPSGTPKSDLDQVNSAIASIQTSTS